MALPEPPVAPPPPRLSQWRLLAFFVFSLAVESATYRATTLFVHSHRPRVHRLEDLSVDASYPSGHTAAAVALAGAHLTFVSRHPEDVDVPGRTVKWEDATLQALVRSADLLLNATPLGRREEMPIRPAALPSSGAVIDLVYVTGGTPLVRKARSLGLPTVDGWEILLAQGARSFEMWTGRSAPVSSMRETLHP